MLGDHFSGVGKGLNNAVAAYNKAVGSLEGRVLVTARRFVDNGVVAAGEKELPRPAPVDAVTRALQAPELLASTLDRPRLYSADDEEGTEGAIDPAEGLREIPYGGALDDHHTA